MCILRFSNRRRLITEQAFDSCVLMDTGIRARAALRSFKERHYSVKDGPVLLVSFTGEKKRVEFVGWVEYIDIEGGQTAFLRWLVNREKKRRRDHPLRPIVYNTFLAHRLFVFSLHETGDCQLNGLENEAGGDYARVARRVSFIPFKRRLSAPWSFLDSYL